jgi:hypothetical protein
MPESGVASRDATLRVAVPRKPLLKNHAVTRSFGEQRNPASSTKILLRKSISASWGWKLAGSSVEQNSGSQRWERTHGPGSTSMGVLQNRQGALEKGSGCMDPSGGRDKRSRPQNLQRPQRWKSSTADENTGNPNLAVGFVKFERERAVRHDSAGRRRRTDAMGR